MTRHLALLFCLFATTARADEQLAIEAFSKAFADTCFSAFNDDGTLVEQPQRFKATSPMTYGENLVMIIWQFRCNIGAYNVQNVFFSNDDTNGVQLLSFAVPDLTIVLQDPSDLESLPKSVEVAGFSATALLPNPTFDPAKGEISTEGYWRGMGDASSAATYRLIDGRFRLVRYDVDASYDEKVNRKTLYTAP